MKLINANSTEKKNQLERLLQFGKVMILLDSRKPGVSVPSAHQGNMQLALNLSYSFQLPDFKVFDDHTEVTLTFPNGKFFCVVPYSAIYSLISESCQQTVVFPTDIPSELLKAPAVSSVEKPTVETPSSSPEPTPASPDKKKKGGHLKLVK